MRGGCHFCCVYVFFLVPYGCSFLLYYAHMSKRSQTHVQTRTSTWIAVGISAALALAAGFAGYLATNPDGPLCKTYPKFCASFVGYDRTETTERTDYVKKAADVAPDLMLTDMSYDSTAMAFSFTYTNKGTEDVAVDTDLVVSLESPLGTTTLLYAKEISDGAGYRVGESSVMEVIGMPAFAGQYVACIDSTDLVTESSEANNCTSILVE